MIKSFVPGTRRDGGAETQSLVSVANIPGLNPKSLSSAYGVKKYVLLLAIRSSDGDVKPGGPLVLSKIIVNADTEFFRHSSLPDIHHSRTTQ